MSDSYDAIVVGAGPYGLSTAAHIRGRGLRVAVFGRVMEFWRRHMPDGMLLRSHWWASNLSDPGGRYGFARFFRESVRHRASYPLPIDAFIDYGLWFQERAVPGVDETYVTSVEREHHHFLLRLEDGRAVRSATVVMATGPRYYAHRPQPFDELPATLVSHSCEHHDLSRFRGEHILIVGGGQSAIEYAALLGEAGATVHVAARRAVLWLDRDRTGERTLFERMLAPDAGIAPGWINWMLEHRPYLFYRLPQARKGRFIRGHYAAAASDWLRSRVAGKMTLHEGRAVARAHAANGSVAVTLSDGATMHAAQIVLATGYQVDLEKLTMIRPSLRSAIAAEGGLPKLDSSFQCSVPGLYFVGLTSLHAFGPLYRFVVGCDAAARRVARSVARRAVTARDEPGGSVRTSGAGRTVAVAEDSAG